MKRMSDEGRQFEGTDLQVRWYFEPERDPVFVVEERDGSQVPLETNRDYLAAALANEMNVPIERIIWYEQAADGKLTEYVFRRGYTIRSVDVPHDRIEAVVGEKLEPYEV